MSDSYDLQASVSHPSGRLPSFGYQEGKLEIVFICLALVTISQLISQTMKVNFDGLPD